MLGIHGSVTPPGRLYQAMRLALGSANKHSELITTSLLHLGDHKISFADGRPLSDYPDDTEAVVRQVMAADMYLIGTQIFRASFTASLKNLLDLMPVEGLMGKVCGLVAMGATDHHYLAVDSQLRPVLAWFGAHLVPGVVYLQSRQFQEGKLADPQAIANLETLATAVVTMQQVAAANQGLMGPPPLAAS
jgi:NAD(P)H-dependent FMN reductase